MVFRANGPLSVNSIILGSNLQVEGRNLTDVVKHFLKVALFMCNIGLPLAWTRWVPSTFSSHCPLSSKQQHWITSASLIIFPLKKFRECWEVNLINWCSFVCCANLHFIIQAHLNTTVHSIVILVGFQFSKFSNLRKKFKYMTVNWMHWPNGLKTKNQRLFKCSNWTLRIDRCPTSDTVLLSKIPITNNHK